MKAKQGYSLIELLMVICILGIMTLISAQGYKIFVRYQLDATTISINQSLELAKALAQQYHSDVMICPVDQDLHCTSTWQGRYQVWNKKTQQIYFEGSIPKQIHIESNLGAAVIFRPQGQPLQFGTLLLVADEHENKIIINQSGRIRTEKRTT